MRSSALLCSIAAITILISCCSKTDTASSDGFTALLEKGDWKITSVKIAPALNGITDFLSVLPPCETDNLFQFRTAGAFYHDEGITKCDSAIAQRDTGTWSYDGPAKILRFSSAVAHTKTLVIKNTTSNTVFGTDEEIINGAAYTYSVTFTRQ